MKNMMKALIAAFAVALGLNTWAASAKLTVYATPSEGGTAKASAPNLAGKEPSDWSKKSSEATNISTKNADVTILLEGIPE